MRLGVMDVPCKHMSLRTYMCALCKHPFTHTCAFLLTFGCASTSPIGSFNYPIAILMYVFHPFSQMQRQGLRKAQKDSITEPSSGSQSGPEWMTCIQFTSCVATASPRPHSDVSCPITPSPEELVWVHHAAQTPSGCPCDKSHHILAGDGS